MNTDFLVNLYLSFYLYVLFYLKNEYRFLFKNKVIHLSSYHFQISVVIIKMSLFIIQECHDAIVTNNLPKLQEIFEKEKEKIPKVDIEIFYQISLTKQFDKMSEYLFPFLPKTETFIESLLKV